MNLRVGLRISHGTYFTKPLNSTALSRRYYRPSQPLAYAYKDQDRESLNPSRSETTQTTSDDDVAHTDEAFNPHETNPKQEQSKTDDDGSSLDVSPASKHVNSVPSEKDMGKDKSTERSGTSGKGSQKKAGKTDT